MANYSDIKGFTVQTLLARTCCLSNSRWLVVSGGNLNGARDMNGRSGGGTLTAGIQFGGMILLVQHINQKHLNIMELLGLKAVT